MEETANDRTDGPTTGVVGAPRTTRFRRWATASGPSASASCRP